MLGSSHALKVLRLELRESGVDSGQKTIHIKVTFYFKIPPNQFAKIFHEPNRTIQKNNNLPHFREKIKFRTYNLHAFISKAEAK